MSITLINLFIIIATFIFTGFALIWKKNSTLNVLIKLAMISMAIFGVFILFKS